MYIIASFLVFYKYRSYGNILNFFRILFLSLFLELMEYQTVTLFIQVITYEGRPMTDKIILIPKHVIISWTNVGTRNLFVLVAFQFICSAQLCVSVTSLSINEVGKNLMKKSTSFFSLPSVNVAPGMPLNSVTSGFFKFFDQVEGVSGANSSSSSETLLQ